MFIYICLCICIGTYIYKYRYAHTYMCIFQRDNWKRHDCHTIHTLVSGTRLLARQKGTHMYEKRPIERDQWKGQQCANANTMTRSWAHIKKDVLLWKETHPCEKRRIERDQRNWQYNMPMPTQWRRQLPRQQSANANTNTRANSITISPQRANAITIANTITTMFQYQHKYRDDPLLSTHQKTCILMKRDLWKQTAEMDNTCVAKENCILMRRDLTKKKTRI